MALVAWFYSFFHARNMAHMPDAEFENQKDEFLLGGRMETETKRIVPGREYLPGCGSDSGNFRNGVLSAGFSGILIWRYLPSSVAFWVDDLFYMLPQILIGVGINTAGMSG